MLHLKSEIRSFRLGCMRVRTELRKYDIRWEAYLQKSILNFITSYLFVGYRTNK